jgi:Tfp pilus assembly protein PilN
MLRTNLSTRPFYNERLVWLALGAAALLVALFTAFNLVRLVTLTRQDRALVGSTRSVEEQVTRLRQEAGQARSRIDRQALEVVAAAAREANGLIDERTFSWTELLNRLETTLPADVRIRAISPVRDQEGRLSIRLAVVARQAEDVDTFVDQLEKSGGFRNVVSRSETTTP